MKISLVTKNLVLVANYFNLSIFRESWFVSQKIFQEDEIDFSKSVFSPALVQIDNKKLQITIQPNLLQANLIGEASLKELEVVERIVAKLPHVPYVALGLNINFFVADDSYLYSSKLFYNPGNKLFEDFTEKSDNPMFGAYLSKNFLESRLKLDIKPVNALLENQKEELPYVHFQFNFHKDLKTESSQSEVQALIGQAEEFFAYSNYLIKKID